MIKVDSGQEWNFDKLDEIYTEIEKIATEKYDLSCYPNHLEVISSEQMLDAYSAVGLPIFYSHWTFGEQFVKELEAYRRGSMNLAYEIVINSSPTITYLMEENTMMMQTLVIAHACVDADTEYLTPFGWKKISEYDGGVVGQYTIEGKMEFVEPINYIVNDCDEMYEFKNSRVHQRLTRDHRVVYKSHENDNIKIKPFHEIKKMHENKTRGFHGKFINVFEPIIDTELNINDSELKLRVAMIADGNIQGKKIRFHLKKKRKIARLKLLLNDLNIKFNIVPTYDGRYKISFTYNIDDISTFDENFYRSSLRQLNIISNEVLLWDGHSGAQQSFSTTSKPSADFIQYAFSATGHRASFRTYNDKRNNPSRKELYTITKNSDTTSGISGGRKKPCEITKFKTIDGKSYCFNVPSEMLVLRCKNYIFVTGNCFGHNTFFKNNYLFKQWTDAEGIIDYLKFTKKFIRKCEELHGVDEVEAVLDAAHSLQVYGVDKYRRPSRISSATEEKNRRERDEYIQSHLNVLWSTIPNNNMDNKEEEPRFPSEPQENILYFIEKNAPRLEEWKREIIRIVRRISQYFYPQRQLQLMNEGCLIAGSSINTENGLMDIKTLVETQYSGKVWDGNDWENVYDWFTHTDKQRIKLITNKGYEIHGGIDHKIQINDEWVKISELKLGDKLNISPISNHKWVKINPNIPHFEMKEHTSIETVCKIFNTNISTYFRYVDSEYRYNMCDINATKCKLVKRYYERINLNISTMSSKRIVPNLPKTMTPDLASWLGYLVGDGNVSINNRVVCLTSGDYEQISEFEKITHNIYGDHVNVVIKKEDNKYRAIISNLYIIEFITSELNIKVGKSSSFKEIPKLIFNSNENTVIRFLKSYFDADGCATKDGKVILVSNSKKLVSGVQELLLYFNIFCSFRLQKDRTYHLVIGGIDALYFRDKIGFALARKQDRLTILDERNFQRRKTTCIIEAIEEDIGTTYDFSVQNSHRYYHKGIINHNCATYFHYKIMYDLYDKDILTDGAMLEFLQSHTGVVRQLDFDHPNYNGINPYALGWAMYKDIERVSMEPTNEDRKWFHGQNWVGNGDYIKNIKWAIENFKDESFIQQFLSPTVIREFKLFNIRDDETDSKLEVTGIHNIQGYKNVRDGLAKQYNIGYKIPDIQVYDVDKWGDRCMSLRHYMVDGRPLDRELTADTLRYISFLWGYDVKIDSVDRDDNVKAEYQNYDQETAIDIFLEDN